MKKLRWGLLGTARINLALIPAIRAAGRSELVAVASRQIESAESFARQHGLRRVYGSYEELLADPEIDVIYNSLPNHLHASWTIRAVQAGKNVLVEKPMALSLAEVDQITQAAEATGRVVSEAFMYRHDPKTLKVTELISGGEIGEVKIIQGSFSYLLDHPQNIRWSPEMGGGSLWDVGCYPVSYSQMIAGQKASHVTAWQDLSPSGVDLDFAGQMVYPGGIVSQFFSSFGIPERSFMEIYGTRGSISVPTPFKPLDPSIPMIVRNKQGESPIFFPLHNIYLGEVVDMEEAVMDGQSPRVSLAESRAHIQTILALYQAAASGKLVTLP